MKRAAEDQLGPERNVRPRIGPLVEGLLDELMDGTYEDTENALGVVEFIGEALAEEVYTEQHVAGLSILCGKVEAVWRNESVMTPAHKRAFLSRLGSYLAKAPVANKNPVWRDFVDNIAQPLLDNVQLANYPTHSELLVVAANGMDIFMQLPYILEKASEEPNLADEGIVAIGALVKVARQYLSFANKPIIRTPLLEALQKFVNAHSQNHVDRLIRRLDQFLAPEEKTIMIYADATYADLFSALAAGDEMLAVNIMKNSGVDYLKEGYEIVRMAVAQGMSMLYTMFMEDSRFQPGFNENELICLAADNRHWALVEMMLKDSRFNPCHFEHKVMFHALNNNMVPFMKMLLVDGRIEAARRDIEALAYKRGYGDIHFMTLYLGDFARLQKAIDKAIATEDLDTIVRLVDLCNADMTVILGTAASFENETVIKLILSSDRIPFSSYSETLEYVLPDNMATRTALFSAVKNDNVAALDSWLKTAGEQDPEYLLWAIFTCVKNFKGDLLHLILKRMAMYESIIDERYVVLGHIISAFDARAPTRHFFNHIADSVIVEIATWLFNALNPQSA